MGGKTAMGWGRKGQGTSVCWWQVSFKEPRQGGLCQKDMGGRGWGGFSMGQQVGGNRSGRGLMGRVLVTLSHSQVRVYFLLIL